ncbi:MAG TPA: hypothetical protein VJX73_13355 [Terracidiphilus sp.]|nr:hypothetical protein [Terracidiphilus sp.]
MQVRRSLPGPITTIIITIITTRKASLFALLLSFTGAAAFVSLSLIAFRPMLKAC